MVLLSGSVNAVHFWFATFAATHIGMEVSHVRSNLVNKYGENGFFKLYNGVSFATFGPLLLNVYIGNKALNGVQLAPTPPLRAGVSTVLAVLGGSLVALGYSYVSPVASKKVVDKLGFKQAEGDQGVNVRGVHRISRHPIMAGFALMSASRLCLTLHPHQLVFWSWMAVFSLLSVAHQDVRKRGKKVSISWYSRTSLLPGYAVLTGKQKLPSFDELNIPALTAGVAFGLAVSLLV